MTGPLVLEVGAAPAGLGGAVDVHGSKACASAVLGLALLDDEPLEVVVPPRSPDWHEAIAVLGATAGLRWDGTALQRGAPSGLRPPSLPVRSRILLNLAGVLASRLGAVELPAPTGCDLGHRPIDAHAEVLRRLGFRLSTSGGVLVCAAGPPRDAAPIHIPLTSSGASIQAILTATALGTPRRLSGLAGFLEVRFLLTCLERAGRLRWGAAPGGTAWAEVVAAAGPAIRAVRPPADAIEAGCWAIAGAMTSPAGIRITYEPSEELDRLLDLLAAAGAAFERDRDTVVVRRPDHRLRLPTVATANGIHTDFHAALACLATTGAGPVAFHDDVFPGRSAMFEAIAAADPHGVASPSPGRWTVRPCRPAVTDGAAPDIRTGFGMILLAARSGRSVRIREAQRITRGFPDIEADLRRLGVPARLVEDQYVP